MSGNENLRNRRRWTEEDFFNHTQWFHGTLYQYADNLKNKVFADRNKGSELDFGYGFYLTPGWEWVKEYAKRTAEVAESTPCILEFRLNLQFFSDMSHRFFDDLNTEFADFVVQNRQNCKEPEKQHQYAYVGGPIADGRPVADLRKYRCGAIAKKELYRRLLLPTEDWQLLLRSQEICDTLVVIKIHNI